MLHLYHNHSTPSHWPLTLMLLLQKNNLQLPNVNRKEETQIFDQKCEFCAAKLTKNMCDAKIPRVCMCGKSFILLLIQYLHIALVSCSYYRISSLFCVWCVWRNDDWGGYWYFNGTNLFCKIIIVVLTLFLQVSPVYSVVASALSSNLICISDCEASVLLPALFFSLKFMNRYYCRYQGDLSIWIFVNVRGIFIRCLLLKNNSNKFNCMCRREVNKFDFKMYDFKLWFSIFF